MCSKQIRVLYAACRIQITCDKEKGHVYGQLAYIFVHFQSQKYVEKAKGRTSKLRAEYIVFVHMLQNDLTWKK
jgi:hypothetical protein